jgi:cytoskeletal protein CcmA (bactofilin family)
MAENANPEFTTILGPDAVFEGKLTFEKGMRLHGKLSGSINSPGRLHVAKEAKMQADVEAGAIVLEGEVQGNLIAADRIEMKQSSRYEGDLTASKLVVEEGAQFIGHVKVGPDAVKNRPQGQPGSRQGIPPAVPQSQPVK